MMIKRCVLSLWLWMVASSALAKPIELTFWHSMAGSLGAIVEQLVHDFNQSQTDYVVKPVYKGNYLECLTSFAAAFQAKKPPAMVQVFEVGASTMWSPPGIIKSVDELMTEQGIPLPAADFFPEVRHYYSKNHQLMAMPFNVSIPVLFYNLDALAKVGYDETSLPKTWQAFEKLAAVLKEKGYTCVYTTGQPAWVLLESFAAIHGIKMVNGSGLRTRYNHEAIIYHLERLRRWQRLHYFEYGGRNDDASVLFTSGRCPIFSESSGSYQSLVSLVPFKVGVGRLPLDEHISAVRHDNVVGGAAIWAVAGLAPEKYRGMALFFAYLSQANIQKKWYEETGYLPLGITGIYRFSEKESQSSVLQLAKEELQGRMKPRIAMKNQLRVMNDDALEAIFAGMKTPVEAMHEAVKRADHVLGRSHKIIAITQQGAK